MTRLRDDELETLLDDVETDRVERKEAWSGDAPDKGCQAICAFANDLPNHQQPGVLFVGAKDNGMPSHITVTDQLLLTFADIKSNGNILPPPTMTVEKRILKGAEVAVVTVWPADAPPVRFKGRIWIRTGLVANLLPCRMNESSTKSGAIVIFTLRLNQFPHALSAI